MPTVVFTWDRYFVVVHPGPLLPVLAVAGIVGFVWFFAFWYFRRRL